MTQQQIKNRFPTTMTTGINELKNRFNLAKERFNPKRGEFGISEMLFNR
jgi:hypothetical protein